MRLAIIGALTFVVGLLISSYLFSLGVLFDMQCRMRWETDPFCHGIIARAEWSLLIPAQGLTVIGAAIYQALREKRLASDRQHRTGPIVRADARSSRDG